MKGQLRELVGQQEWGIIHADVQLGNIIVAPEGPCYIDFGFSGYSLFHS
ncbi:phosphotransferase [Paenibacillus ihuae]